MNIEEFIKVYSEKLGYTTEEIKQEYEKLIEDENKLHPNLTEDQRKTRALQRLAMTYKRLLRSPAVVFEGIVIGVSPVINTMAARIRMAKQMFAENPQEAIRLGLTDENGTPLDNLKTFSTGRENPNYGKPLQEERLLCTVYGLACPKGGEVKEFILQLNDAQTKQKIPILQPVRFRAINRSQEGDEKYILGGSVLTKFEKADIKLPEITTLLREKLKHYNIKISEIKDFHEKHKDDFNRLAIIEGDVITLQLEPNPVSGNRLMVINDDPINPDSKDLLCWIPPHIDIDFGEQSRVLVIGQTAEMPKRLEDGSYSDTEKDNCLNVYGIYAIPEYKISPEVEEVTEEVVNGQKEEQEEKPTGGW